MESKLINKMNFKKIKPGEVLSTTMYLTVLSKDKDSIRVRDNHNREFTVKGVQLIEQTMHSSAQYEKVLPVTRTELADILTRAGDTVFEANFVKQDGTSRVLVGRLLDVENTMGRSNAVDLQITAGHNQRQIDHRTLNYLVYKGNKYEVKNK